VSGNNLVARQACDTLGGSGEGSTVSGFWRVESCRERINGATSWARMRLLDGGESQRLQSLYVGFGDARCRPSDQRRQRDVRLVPQRPR
jgi:hypothetical protein